MFMTPLALELARRCLVSLGGAVSMPWTAESTLVSGSDMLGGFAGSCLDQVIDESLQRTDWSEQPALRWRKRETEELMPSSYLSRLVLMDSVGW